MERSLSYFTEHLLGIKATYRDGEVPVQGAIPALPIGPVLPGLAVAEGAREEVHHGPVCGMGQPGPGLSEARVGPPDHPGLLCVSGSPHALLFAKTIWSDHP